MNIKKDMEIDEGYLIDLQGKPPFKVLGKTKIAKPGNGNYFTQIILPIALVALTTYGLISFHTLADAVHRLATEEQTLHFTEQEFTARDARCDSSMYTDKFKKEVINCEQ